MYKDRQKFQETVTAVIEQGEWSGELVKLTKSGREVTVQSRSTLILGQDHRPKAILIINSDVTDQKRLEAHMLGSAAVGEHWDVSTRDCATI